MTVLLRPGYSRKYQLHVVRDLQPDAGSLVGMPGGRKGVTHITVTNERHVHAARDALVGEGFEPNVLVGFEIPTRRPFLYQFAPLNHASKALQHVTTPETNRGGPVVCQMEIACMVADVPNFHDIQMYKVLANAWRMINEHLDHPIPWNLWAPSVATPAPGRLSSAAYIAASGHGGHRDVPDQPAGHDDPTGAFDWSALLHNLHHMPSSGAWDLSHAGF